MVYHKMKNLYTIEFSQRESIEWGEQAAEADLGLVTNNRRTFIWIETAFLGVPVWK
jgi:hypothetical protein